MFPASFLYSRSTRQLAEQRRRNRVQSHRRHTAVTHSATTEAQSSKSRLA